MSSTRIAFLALALLAVLFAVGVGAGACSGDEGSSKSEGSLVERLGSLFVSPQPLPLGDIDSSCFAGGVLRVAPGGPCAARIAESDTAVRELRLRLLQGGEVQVELAPRGEGGVRVKSKLNASAKELDLQVFRGGADLSLRFVSAPPGGGALCTVGVARD